MIPVYENDEIIARITYNENLDYWDGSNWTCGGVGLHKGLTKLKKSGKYVLIHGSQWQGSKNYGEVISAKEAVREILRSGNEKLFDKFPELKNVIKEEFDEEFDN